MISQDAKRHRYRQTCKPQYDTIPLAALDIHTSFVKRRETQELHDVNQTHLDTWKDAKDNVIVQNRWANPPTYTEPLSGKKRTWVPTDVMRMTSHLCCSYCQCLQMRIPHRIPKEVCRHFTACMACCLPWQWYFLLLTETAWSQYTYPNQLLRTRHHRILTDTADTDCYNTTITLCPPLRVST